MACARMVPSLLLHVNIFLVLFAGAGLATGARLKWDPSTYVVLREMFPGEYRAAAVALPLAAVVLLLLAHCAALALRTRRPALRRVLLLSYALVMALMMCAETALAWWLAARVVAWTHSPAAQEMQRLLGLREHLLPLLQELEHWHPLPTKVKSIIKEAETDAPRNLHVLLAATALLALLQALAVLLALLLAARDRRARRDRDAASAPLRTSPNSEKTPPRVVYRDGRLVVRDAATTPHSA